MTICRIPAITISLSNDTYTGLGSNRSRENDKRRKNEIDQACGGQNTVDHTARISFWTCWSVINLLKSRCDFSMAHGVVAQLG